MMHHRKFVLAIAASIGLGACTQQPVANAQARLAPPATEQIDQSDVCIFRDLGNTGRCKLGQKLVLLPEESFAREELSLTFAAQFCDFRYSVIVNARGVVCIYYPTAQKAGQTPDSIDAAARAAVEAIQAAEEASRK